ASPEDHAMNLLNDLPSLSTGRGGTALASIGAGALLALSLTAPAGAQELTRDDLIAELKQRDAAIAALEKRVAALEGEHVAAPMSAGTSVTGSAPALIPAQAAAAPPAGGATGEAQ